MTPNRRTLLAGLAGTAALPLAGWAAPDAPELLEPRPFRARLLPDTYPETELWGYGNAAPGPEIRAGQGSRLVRRLVNGLPAPTSVHWHGIRLPNAMDGVSGLTQAAVAPGASFDYDFALPDAGTYWYHSHHDSTEQVGRGLHGALIVEEPEGARPDVDRELVLVLGDWVVGRDGQLVEPFVSPHEASHGGRFGNVITTNGRVDFSEPVRAGERIRLRLINAATARVFPLALHGLEGWTVALDGMPLAVPLPAEEALVLGPAQRMDLVVDVTAAEGEEAALVHLDDTPFAQAGFPVQGRTATARRGAPAPLPPNREAPAEGEARALRLVLEGGAMGMMRQAVHEGERMGFRALAGQGQFWAMNGVAGMPEAPLATLSTGEPVRLEIENRTRFPHAMHLHGMHFRELGPDDTPGPMRDTTLVWGGETRTVRFVADNPGEWLLHCHMLSHGASGMMTRVAVG